MNVYASHHVQTSSESRQVDRAEHPERTRGDKDESSALLSAHPHGLEKVSETSKDRNNVFSGTSMLDMSDNAWLVIKIRTDTQKGMATTAVHSVELVQQDIEKCAGHGQLFVG